MEIRLSIENEIILIKFVNLLDSLATLYSLDENCFVDVYEKMPKSIKKEFENIAQVKDKFDDTDLEDVIDYANEVSFYYESWARKLAEKLEKEREKKSKEPQNFTLRNPEDLRQFEEFLDRIIKLLELSPGHFIEIIPQCPAAYWDKIDDLRETSYKRKRDSDEYLRCLEKCKRISFTYSEFADSLSKNKEDEF